jgi:indole-3-glycerol phosphate synthase
MTILDQIVAHKQKEVKERKSLYPAALLEKSIFFNHHPLSLKESLIRDGQSGIIAEFKRKSPSVGIINQDAKPEQVCSEYIEGGASAVSVLTDSEFFGGSSDDLINVRKIIRAPVLRKDFILDEYQILEARSMGADSILLITGILKKRRIDQLHHFARFLGMEVLVEVHDEKDFSLVPDDAQMVGINSRNLASLLVDHDNLARLIKLIPKNIVKVAESGIKSVSDYLTFKNAGFNGFLIGELFMNNPDPGKACKIFISELLQSGAISGLNKHG